MIAWQKLMWMAKGRNKLRIHELSKKVTNPTRVKTYGEVQQAVDKWETLVAEFEKTRG